MLDGAANGDDDTAEPDAMSRFRRLVLGSGALPRRLAAHRAIADFVADASALAEAAGIALDPEELRAPFGATPVEAGRIVPAPINLADWPGPGWRPIRMIADPRAPMIDWAWFGEEPLSAPFYDDDVRCAAALPFNVAFRLRTPVVTGTTDASCPRPDGLIFHMSRCGSTLSSRMLAAVPTHLVVSEPAPLDDVVRWAAIADVPSAAKATTLRAIAGALGRHAGGRLFIKLDSWHARALPLFRAAFPDTPWIFLYRDPTEVLVSLLARPGLQAVPGALPPNVLDIACGETMPREDYCALVLDRLCSAVVEHWHRGGGMVVDYADLPGAMLTRVPRHFGFRLDQASASAMALAAQRDAKSPDRDFFPDTARKQQEATPAIRRAIEHGLQSTMHQLRLLGSDQSACSLRR